MSHVIISRPCLSLKKFTNFDNDFLVVFSAVTHLQSVLKVKFFEPQQKQNSHSDDDDDNNYRDSNSIDNDDIAYNDSTHTGNPEIMGNNMFISVPQVSIS